MALIKSALLMASVLAVCYAAPQRGNNEYLPPDQGYNYPKPQVPFQSSPPATEYRPPAPPVSRPPPPPVSRPPPPPVSRPPPPPPPSYGPPPQQTYNPPPKPQYTPPPPQYTPPPPQRPAAPYPPSQQDIGHDGSHDHSHSADHVHEPGMPYDFNYAVKDDTYGTDFSQNEVSDGDNVKGEYRVQLPDGRLQIVRYHADWKTGFHAEVTYEGEARYPEPAPYKPQPQGQGSQQQNQQQRPNNQGDSGYNYPAPQQNNPSSNYGAPNTGY